MTRLSRSTWLVLAALALTLLGFGAAAAPYVAGVPSGGEINFFDVSASACTTTVWNGGTFSDGNIGFGGNLGDPHQIPVVANGQEICIQIVLTAQAASTSFTISTPGSTLTLVSGSNPFKTDSSGNANVFLIFSVSNLSGDCTTHPIDISPDIAGGAGSGGQIHHIYGGSGACGGTTPFPPPPSSVPQFPLGAAGMGLAMAAGFAGMILVKRKQLKA